MRRFPLALCAAFFTGPAAPTGHASAAEPSAREWTPLIPERMEATGGAVLTHRGDGVIVAGGANPDRVTYEIACRTEVTSITAFRLDALLDPILPHGGPGRADNANFVLSEMEVLSSRGLLGSRAAPVRLSFAAADHEQVGQSGRFEAKYAIDGVIDDDGGWSGENQRFREPRALVVIPDRPVEYPAGCELVFRLHFASRHARHSIGAFRLSLTSHPDPMRMLPARRPPSRDDVADATERGIAWLVDHQLPDGSWPGPDAERYFGMAALGAYTLVQCGLSPDHPTVKAALSFVDHRPIERTYDIGCALMAFKAAGDEHRLPRVQELADLLIDTMGNARGSEGKWGYPFGWDPGSTSNHLDLSNTQYALLGLRAAAAFGVRIPASVWRRAADSVLELQGDYGSFRYAPGRNPSASMTVAGMACLDICLQHLPANKPTTRNRLRAAWNLSEEWLRRNWSVEENLTQPRSEGGESDRWYYYYMYGLERVGSLAGRKQLAGHDWHAEGARALIRRQNDDGSWSSRYGEKDANTCFALMYLVRGTRPTGAVERPEARATGGDDAFSIQAGRQNPIECWVGALGPTVQARLDAGDRVVGVDWLIDGALAQSVAPSAASPLLDRFAIRRELHWNGLHTVQAVMRFETPEGVVEERSRALELRVDGVEEPRHREAVFDNAHRAIDPDAVSVTASSHTGGHRAEHAADGRFGTHWVSASDDRRPMLELRFRRPVRAAALKLTAAHPWLGAEAHFARPREVEVQINGGKAWRFEMLDDVRNKQGVVFARTTVRRLRVRILSVYPGVSNQTAAGFKEVELIGEADPQGRGTRVCSRLETLLPRGTEPDAPLWAYTTEEPDALWTRPDFDDSSWSRGRPPFGNGSSPIAPNTTWAGGDRELWIRGSFRLEAPPTGRVIIELLSDDQAEVFVNGVLATRNLEYSRGTWRATQVIDAVQDALRPGMNVIAAHCRDTGGAAALDVAVRIAYPATP